MGEAESDVYITVGMEKWSNSPLQGKSNKTHRPALSSANLINEKKSTLIVTNTKAEDQRGVCVDCALFGIIGCVNQSLLLYSSNVRENKFGS